MSEPTSDPPADKPKKRWITEDTVRWVITLVVIPLTVELWGYWQSHLQQQRADHEADQANRARQLQQHIANEQANVDLIIKMMPQLQAPPGEPGRMLAVTIVNKMMKQDGADKDSVATAAMDAERFQIGKHYIPGKGYDTPGAINEAELLEQLGQHLNSQQIQAAVTSGHDVFAGAIPLAYDTSMVSQVPAGKVYIQIVDESQRPQAEKIKELLHEMGIAVPGIENVTATAALNGTPAPQPHTQLSLLVFKPNDLFMAKQIVERASAAGFAFRLEDHTQQPAFAKVPTGQLELWFPRKQ
jgi:hypothetical protein